MVSPSAATLPCSASATDDSAYRPDLACGEALLAELARSDAPQREFQQMFAAAVARWTSGEFDHEYTRSWQAFRAAVLAGVEVLASQDAATIWAFTSGGPIAVIVNTSVSRVTLSARRSALISYNGWPHLEGNDATAMVTYR